jgi:hypothetical protein
MNARRHGPAGFLLLPVSLLLAVIGALSYMLVQDIGSAARPGGRENERARLVAEAGLAHATWKLNQVSGCSGYSAVAATPFGSGGDQYQVSPQRHQWLAGHPHGHGHPGGQHWPAPGQHPADRSTRPRATP